MLQNAEIFFISIGSEKAGRDQWQACTRTISSSNYAKAFPA
jgi:hypothetical protein